MPLDVDDGKAIACNAIVGRIRDQIDLVQVDTLPSPVYGFDPSGWLIFSVLQRGVFGPKGDWFVAVHEKTSEFRDLGRLGE